MNISELLDRPIAYHRVFVTLTGSVKAAILLSQAIYWQKRARQADGWWYKTTEEWQDETGLTRHEQDSARQKCEKYLKTDLRDVPARLYWKVDEEELTKALFAENRQTVTTKTVKQDARNSSNINRNAEITTETTTINDNNQSLSTLSKLYSDNIGAITPLGADLLRNISIEYPEAWYEQAMKVCVANNARNLKYFETVLRNMKEKGLDWRPERKQSKAQKINVQQSDRSSMIRPIS